MNTCKLTLHIIILSASLNLLSIANASAAVGIIEDAKEVTLKADATGRGAAAGAIIGGVRETNDRGASVAKGALVGGMLGRRNSPTKPGKQYIIRTSTGMTTVVTDQVSFAKGDCVSIQQSGERSSITRADKKQCDSIKAPAKPDTNSKPAEQSKNTSKPASNEACATAKQEVANAKTKEALDFAKQKMDALCK